jgi:hypothetical protein
MSDSISRAEALLGRARGAIIELRTAEFRELVQEAGNLAAFETKLRRMVDHNSICPVNAQRVIDALEELDDSRKR